MPPLYPQSKVLLCDAWSVLVSWVLLALLPVGYFALKLSGSQSIALLTVLLALFLSAAVLHGVLSFMHRCPVCRKHPTIQTFSAPHPASAGQSEAGGWSGAVVNVLRRRKLVCIHCGSEFQVQT